MIIIDSNIVDRVLSVCKEREWPLDNISRGGYLHLEVSELIEACRGKGSDKETEAADVLITLMSIIATNELSLNKVSDMMYKKLKLLEEGKIGKRGSL